MFAFLTCNLCRRTRLHQRVCPSTSRNSWQIPPSWPAGRRPTKAKPPSREEKPPVPKRVSSSLPALQPSRGCYSAAPLPAPHGEGKPQASSRYFSSHAGCAAGGLRGRLRGPRRCSPGGEAATRPHPRRSETGDPHLPPTNKVRFSAGERAILPPKAQQVS